MGAISQAAELWDLETGGLASTITAHSSGWCWVAFSPNGANLATASGYYHAWDKDKGDKNAKVWDVRTGDQVSTLTGHTAQVNCIAFSPDGQYVATGSWDNTVKLWNANTSRVLWTQGGHDYGVHSLAFSPDGRLLVTGDGRGTVRIWNVKTRRIEKELRGRASYVVYEVAFSLDSKRLAVATSDNAATLWDVETGREVLTLTGHSNWVWAIAFSPDGKQLATGSLDHTAILRPSFPWDENDYPGDDGMPLDERIELCKRRYWKEYLESIKAGARMAAPVEEQNPTMDAPESKAMNNKR
jgi:WD40 repeat protein